MAQKTPSFRRREGRKAFDPQCDPLDFCPYKPPQWGWDMYQEDWLDGWNEALKAYGASRIKLKYYCGCYTGPIPIIGEPAECQYENEIIVDIHDWLDGSICIDCPECGAELHQSMDHFEVML